jgi:non-ribosomal peptide synthetase component F
MIEIKQDNRDSGDVVLFSLFLSSFFLSSFFSYIFIGVVIAHQGLNNYVAWLTRFLHLGAADRWLATINAAFDPSVYEALMPLTVGGRVIYFDRVDPIDVMSMVTAIKTHGITGMTAGL